MVGQVEARIVVDILRISTTINFFISGGTHMVFKWKRNNVPVEAQVVGEHLKKLETENGVLTTSIIVEDSRPNEALLHDCFEWNDQLAAEEYRKTQAGYILRNLVTVKVIESEKEEREDSIIIVRTFVNVNVDEVDRGFISVETAMSNKDTRQQVLKNALSELNAFKNKYNDLMELSKVFEAIDSALLEIGVNQGANE